jgi:two-component system, cell cycle sensor histidine kinase and response regulator CckA
VIDLLVTDLVMPGMSGAELAHRLEAERPETRVLYMSGYTNDQRARALIAQGADFLRKPFQAAAFTQRVREMVEGDGLVLQARLPGSQKSNIHFGKRDLE